VLAAVDRIVVAPEASRPLRHILAPLQREMTAISHLKVLLLLFSKQQQQRTAGPPATRPCILGTDAQRARTHGAQRQAGLAGPHTCVLKKIDQHKILSYKFDQHKICGRPHGWTALSQSNCANKPILALYPQPIHHWEPKVVLDSLIFFYAHKESRPKDPVGGSQ